jgi:hypothetical protein
VSEEQPGAAAEHADYSEDDCDEALPPAMTSIDAATTVTDATEKKPIFTKGLAHRDDWLHRGIMPRDMDYYHYSRYVGREEMPRSGSAQRFQKNNCVYYSFDAHSPLARTYVQILLSTQRRCKASGHNANDQMLMAARTTPCIKHTCIRACTAREPSSARTL